MRRSSELIGIIAFLFAMTAAAPASASNYLKCDGCSPTQMRQLAVQQGFGRYLVGSVPDHTLRAYLVTPAGSTDTKLQARDGEIYPPERKAFSALIDFYNAPPAGYSKHYTVNYPGAGDSSKTTQDNTADRADTFNYADPQTTAYDVIDGGPRQTEFLQSIKDSGAFKVYGKPPFVEVFPRFLTVAFTDGSRIGVYIDTKTLPHQLSVNPNSARDSHLNNIPPSTTAVAGEGVTEYSFAGPGNARDAQQMRDRIEAFGIKIPAGNSYECSRFVSPPAHEKTRCRPHNAQRG